MSSSLVRISRLSRNSTAILLSVLAAYLALAVAATVGYHAIGYPRSVSGAAGA